jgi:hypothetical protein
VKDSIKKTDDVGRNLNLMSSTKKAISIVLDLGLKQAFRRWKANLKIYKVIFHESLQILMFTRSKEPPFTGCLNWPLLEVTIVKPETFVRILFPNRPNGPMLCFSFYLFYVL